MTEDPFVQRRGRLPTGSSRRFESCTGYLGWSCAPQPVLREQPAVDTLNAKGSRLAYPSQEARRDPVRTIRTARFPLAACAVRGIGVGGERPGERHCEDFRCFTGMRQ